MKSMKNLKLSLMFSGIWLFCFVFYLATAPGNGYVATPEGAKVLGGFMSECSGEIIKHGDAAYRCDGYGPSKVAIVIMLVGAISFIAAILALMSGRASKTKS